MNLPAAHETRDPEPATRPPTVFSQSEVWGLQRAFFERTGIEAWRKNQVPSYITTNPYIAHTYAELIRAWLDDCRRAGLLRAGQTVHIVELGAGAGRLAHNILAQLLDEMTPLPCRICYVMTDLGRANLAFWRGHEKLQGPIERGELDFAQFDATSDRALRLEVSGRVLALGSDAGPLIVIGNYFVDGIEHDVFRVEAGSLDDYCVAPRREAETDGQVALDWHARPCGRNRYDEPWYDAFLRDYAGKLGDNAIFLFPIAAMRCFDALNALAGGRTLFLLGDKGHVRQDEAALNAPPRLVWHGSFSLDVNFHALGEWAARRSGTAFAPTRAHASLAVVAYPFGGDPADWPALRAAYGAAVETFGPDDFYHLKKASEPAFDTMSLPQILALLRLSRWDPVILVGCYERLLETLPDAADAQRATLHAGLDTLWRRYLPLGEDDDVAFHVGCLLAGMGHHADAVALFEASLRWHGDDEATRANLTRSRTVAAPAQDQDAGDGR